MNNKAKKAICRKEDLGNEASVEQFFVDRLLKRLGWADSQIKTKESISELSVNLGRKKMPYKPDYALSYRRKVRFVIDAKSTKENLDSWVGQCSSYCLLINQGYKDNPVQYFVLTNGVTCSHPPCNFAARGGGFSLKATDVASIDELSPCAPRFRFL